jgi:hypothetical protein
MMAEVLLRIHIKVNEVDDRQNAPNILVRSPPMYEDSVAGLMQHISNRAKLGADEECHKWIREPSRHGLPVQ